MKGDMRQLVASDYPANLGHIPDVPTSLWMQGAWPQEGTKLLAVVGSRALSRYGKEACESLIAGLRGYPISIVSGLALGADACAHRAALANGLHTIAVPGSGLGEEVLYPRAHVSLARDILAAGGALLSEHPGDHKAAIYDFPSRNRIMAGMSDAVLMIEASERSGTLITARLASEYNRELLTIPHRIGDAHGFGPHLFLRLGATLVTESAHILEALGITATPSSRTHMPTLEGVEDIVYALLKEPMTRDALIRASAKAPGEILTALVSLELRGMITETFGAWRRS